MRLLEIMLVAYAAASLLHFTHNAEFLSDYPNMPAWLSRPGIYAMWLGATAVGVLGYVVLRRGYEVVGFAFIALYAAVGFDSLGHYSLAPFAEHGAGMHVTIWLEVMAAALLLGTIVCSIRIRFRGGFPWH